MLLYPTETIYALGVNALDPTAMERLYTTKGRVPEKPVSVLVRDRDDIATYAHINAAADKVIDALLPGPLTLVLPATSHTPKHLQLDGMVSFRISPDPIAQQVIAAFMKDHYAPLTCTSANRSGYPPEADPARIREQLGEQAQHITTVHDDGPRAGAPSTVLTITDTDWYVIRSGSISSVTISDLLIAHPSS